MGYDREDATRLAQAAYRKRQYDEQRRRREQGQEREHSPGLDALLAHDRTAPLMDKGKFNNPDVEYLVGKLPFERKWVAQAVRFFGEGVVVEGLRRCVESSITERPAAWGVFRNVERELVP